MLLRSLSCYCVNITTAITKNRTNESPTPEKGLGVVPRFQTCGLSQHSFGGSSQPEQLRGRCPTLSHHRQRRTGIRQRALMEHPRSSPLVRLTWGYSLETGHSSTILTSALPLQIPAPRSCCVRRYRVFEFSENCG